ncbi:MAG: UDP-N-acetylglucosamine 1-carboxyvinyltransferase [Clostridia bacterium]|nr:UDP-N-acetylglucosamine 1-carboxyvinyltransferase [Clostridia bacterium]
MEKVIIDGGTKLEGTITVSGMKNAAVAVLYATVLAGDVCVIENLPNISDVVISLEILKSVGATVEYISETEVKIDTTNVLDKMPPDKLTKKMRASYYLIGATLGRFGHSIIGYPGGCDFGVRPIDQHIKAFNALGADVSTEGNVIEATAREGRLKASNIFFDCVTVGGTMNAMLAAVLAEGTTEIENAAREPHIVALANFLNFCGANVSGAGTDKIKIKGVEKLHGCTYELIPDMIEAGTYMIAAAATGGNLYIDNVIPKHLEAITVKMREMGVTIDEYDDGMRVYCEGPLCNVDIKTSPYPGFPTDMNPQIAVLMCLANGEGVLTDTIWDNRFRYVEELKRMNADIDVEGNMATFAGSTVFKPARVRAVDLRAGAAMIIAGLVAKGQTEIDDFFYVERGYDNIIEKLRGVGAHIMKIG